MSDPATAVVDDIDHHRFVYTEGDEEAELVYKTGSGRLVLAHTGVPESLGGRGIGGMLVRAAIARARDTGETVVPWCPYVLTWLQEHPDEAAGVTVDWEDQPPATAGSETPSGTPST